MTTVQKINEVRRRLMRNITRNVGRTHTAKNIVLTGASEIERILICRPNDRLGNLLLITPLLQEIRATFPNCTVDLFVRGGAAPIVFKNYDFVDRIIMLPKRPFSQLFTYSKRWLSIRKKSYDLAINVENNSSSGKLSTMFARSKYKFFGEAVNDATKHYPDYNHIAKYPVYNFRHYMTTLGLRRNNAPVAPLDLKLSPSEKAQGADILRQLTGNERKTISLFTFATGSKCYSQSWWADCYKRLKATYPDYNIVEILPAHNQSQIGYEAPSFYSKDVREIGAVIAHSDLFIGADSGIMHLSASVKTPTVGLFSVTNMNKYGPYGAGSFGVNTNETPFEQWIPLLANLFHGTDPQPKSA